jgi:cellulose synthase operon protein C
VRRRLLFMASGAAGLILMAIVILVARPDHPTLGQSMAEVQNLIKLHKYRDAHAELLTAVRANPKSTEALLAQATVALELFDGVTAQSSLEKAIALGVPARSVAHLLGHSYWLQGELDEAEDILASEDIAPKNGAYANRILGRVYMDKGDFVAAQQAFQTALRQAPNDGQTWTDIARLRFISADQKGAIEAVEQALKIDANNVRALEFRGRLMRSQFGLVAALPWFERGLQISPEDVPLLEEYALTLGEAGRNRDMLEQARKIVALDGGNSKAFFMQAVLAARAGNYELANRILPRAGDAFTELPGPMLLDGIIEFELGNYNRAVDRFVRLLGAQPRNRRVRALLAQAMYRAGDPLDTLDTIREIAARGDADSYSLMLTARAFEASGQRSRSFKPLDEAALAVIRPSLPLPDPVTLLQASDEVRRNPNDARAVVPYIRLLMLNGDIDAASQEANRLQAANPGVADAHLLAGDIAIAQGNFSEALAAYQLARSISFSEPVMLRLVDAAARAGDAKTADDALAQYLAFNPTSLTALRLAGYRNLDSRQWSIAIALLERVRARIGYNDSILLANLARAYAGARKTDRALDYAATAYRIAPANAMVTKVYADILKRSGKRPKAAAELARKVVAQRQSAADFR